jgi:hypothetical protein
MTSFNFLNAIGENMYIFQIYTANHLQIYLFLRSSREKIKSNHPILRMFRWDQEFSHGISLTLVVKVNLNKNKKEYVRSMY